MAEESKENNEIQETQETQNEGSWWGSWINSAKNKTSTVFEAVKKDLDELSTAVRTEASNVGAAIENTLKFNEETSPVGNVKKSLSTFFGQVTEALIPSIDDDDVETILIRNDDLITLTGFQKHLADLQFNDQTYLNEPDNELKDKYKLWMEVIEQDQFTQDRLAKHLANSEILNEKYLTHVPDNVSHMDFWQRYLFRRALLEDALANAEIAERRAKNEINSTKPLSPRKNIIQTEQPKLTCNENDIIKKSINNDNIVNVDIKSNDNEKIIDDNNEKMIKQKKLNKTKTTTTTTSSGSTDNLKNVKNDGKDNVNDDNDDDIDDDLIDDNINWDNEEIPNNVELSEEEQIRLLEQYEQEIQEREKKRNENNSNNKGKKNKTTTSATKSSSINLKQQSTTKSTNQQQNKRQNSQNKNKNSNTINNLIIQKDHFNKDETSSTSDESWEKDFDLND